MINSSGSDKKASTQEERVKLTPEEMQWLYEQKQKLNGLPTGTHRKHS